MEGGSLSINYQEGVKGCQIDANGNLYANSGTFRGTVSAGTISGCTITGGTLSIGTNNNTKVEIKSDGLTVGGVLKWTAPALWGSGQSGRRYIGTVVYGGTTYYIGVSSANIVGGLQQLVIW